MRKATQLFTFFDKFLHIAHTKLISFSENASKKHTLL